MTKKIASTLSHFGLTDPEIDLYLALLKYPKSSAAELARKTNIQRTNVYFHLREMEEKALISKLKSGTVSRFTAIPPKKLAERFQSWTSGVFQILPQLEALSSTQEQAPIVSVHDFKIKHYEHYLEIASMPKGSEFRVIQSNTSANEDFDAFKNDELQTVLREMVKNNIMTRAIFTNDFIKTAKKKMSYEVYELFLARNWQLRTINRDRFDFEEMMIHQDKVTFLLTDIKILVQIQHKRIAKAMIAMFDALWLTGESNTFK